MSDNNIKTIIPENFHLTRVDRFLTYNYNIKHSKICELSRKGLILVNNIKAKFSDKLKTGDVIKVNNLLIDRDNKLDNKENAHNGNPKILQDIIRSIVFENDDLVCINKKSGLAVQGGTGIKDCIENYLSRIINGKKLYIVHRLDKETSGLLLLAKSRQSAQKLTQLFKDKQIEKTYLAILANIPTKKDGIIETRIIENESSAKTKQFNTMRNLNKDSETGKIAITQYRVLEENREKSICLVEMKPITGRKHQLRIHAKYIGCSIVGDTKYNNNKNDIITNLQLYAVRIKCANYFDIAIDTSDIYISFQNI